MQALEPRERCQRVRHRHQLVVVRLQLLERHAETKLVRECRQPVAEDGELLQVAEGAHARRQLAQAVRLELERGEGREQGQGKYPSRPDPGDGVGAEVEDLEAAAVLDEEAGEVAQLVERGEQRREVGRAWVEVWEVGLPVSFQLEHADLVRLKRDGHIAIHAGHQARRARRSRCCRCRC